MGGELPPVHISWAHTLFASLGSGPETQPNREYVVRELGASGLHFQVDGFPSEALRSLKTHFPGLQPVPSVKTRVPGLWNRKDIHVGSEQTQAFPVSGTKQTGGTLFFYSQVSHNIFSPRPADSFFPPEKESQKALRG